MDPQAPASFIPKKSFTPGPSHGEGAGLLFLIALLIFIVSLVAAGLVFGYEQYLNQSIANKSAVLQKDQSAIDLSSINDLVRMDNRILQAKILLAGHVAPSALFDFLSQQTLLNVQFTSFNYQLQPNGSALVTLQGIADSFSTLALQSDQFGSSNMLKNIIFSNINTNTSGQVVFTLSTNVSQALLLYSNKLITGATSNQNVQPIASSSIPILPATTTPLQ